MYVAKAVNESQTELYVSVAAVNFSKYKKVEVGDETSFSSYTIIDATENSVFLFVNSPDNKRQGDVYISNAEGDKFSLSLKNVLRNSSGIIDFERIESMEGTFIAN